MVPSRHRGLWIAFAAAFALLTASVDITTTGPRVTVRWRDAVDDATRSALEQRYDLRKGTPEEGATWRYELGRTSQDNIAALVRDPAIEDTGYIDRGAMTVSAPDTRVTVRWPFPFNTDNRFERRAQLFQWQSLWLLLTGATLLWAAGTASESRRRNVAVGALVLVGVMGIATPVPPALVTMGDANQLVRSRNDFETRGGVHSIRFEAHLSYAILGQLDRLFGRTDDAPARAQKALAQGATTWFVTWALVVLVLERWSPHVLRYVGLALLAPSTILYFGWREFGYLSLNIAAFPFIVRGLREGGRYLELGSLLSGLGAAFHGWGLVALAGAWMAALTSPNPLRERVTRALRVSAWGTAAYVGWVAIYVIVLKFPILVGHTEAIPWRPWFADQIFAGRLNPAVFSAMGSRDLFMIAWVVGAPLFVVAPSVWREHGHEVRTALAYTLPSVVVTLTVWHTQGLHDDMDVVFAVFPAIYALAWVCARSPRSAAIAAGLLVSAHLAFWRIVFDTRFMNTPLN